MVPIPRFFVLLATLAALPAAAQAVEMRYEVFWGGFRAGEARLAHDGIRTELDAAAAGNARRLFNFRMEAEAEPGRYGVQSRSKRAENRVAVEFDPGQPARTVVDELVRLQPDEDDEREPRPPVPPELRLGARDPLSGLMEFGRLSLAALEGGPRRFTLPLFDGRHRFDVKALVRGRETMSVGERRMEGAAVEVEIVPLAGFRQKSRETWAGARFIALVDPATRLPVRIVSDSFAIATVITALPPQQGEVSEIGVR